MSSSLRHHTHRHSVQWRVENPPWEHPVMSSHKFASSRNSMPTFQHAILRWICTYSQSNETAMNAFSKHRTSSRSVSCFFPPSGHSLLPLTFDCVIALNGTDLIQPLLYSNRAQCTLPFTFDEPRKWIMTYTISTVSTVPITANRRPTSRHRPWLRSRSKQTWKEGNLAVLPFVALQSSVYPVER